MVWMPQSIWILLLTTCTTLCLLNSNGYSQQEKVSPVGMETGSMTAKSAKSAEMMCCCHGSVEQRLKGILPKSCGIHKPRTGAIFRAKGLIISMVFLIRCSVSCTWYRCVDAFIYKNYSAVSRRVKIQSCKIITSYYNVSLKWPFIISIPTQTPSSTPAIGISFKKSWNCYKRSLLTFLLHLKLDDMKCLLKQ